MEDFIDLIFTEIDGLPYPNMAGLNLEELRVIYKRDPGKRTTTGKVLKEIARKEFAYIYFKCKRDFFKDYSVKDRDTIIRNRINMPEKWQPDEVVLNCIKAYSEDCVTVQDKLLRSSRSAADNYLDLFDEIQAHNERLLQFLQKNVEELDSEELAKREVEINKAKALFKEYFNTIKDLKGVIDIIDELERFRVVNKKKENRKNISSHETDHNKYIPRERNRM